MRASRSRWPPAALPVPSVPPVCVYRRSSLRFRVTGRAKSFGWGEDSNWLCPGTGLCSWNRAALVREEGGPPGAEIPPTTVGELVPDRGRNAERRWKEQGRCRVRVLADRVAVFVRGQRSGGTGGVAGSAGYSKRNRGYLLLVGDLWRHLVEGRRRKPPPSSLPSLLHPQILSRWSHRAAQPAVV